MVYNLLRFFLAVIFALLGYRFAFEVLSFAPFWAMSLLVVLGAFIGFNLPSSFIFLWQKFFKRFTETLALEVVRQIRSKLPLPPKTTLRPKIQSSCPPLILDTSAVIDGRVRDILKTGFLHGTVVVPDFVLGELQNLADSPQTLKRAKGRRGLAILEEIKGISKVGFKIWTSKFRRQFKTDEKLIKLAQKLKGAIVTSDFNLNKVAKVSGITVLNVNELANAVKTQVLPGEKLKIKIVQVGKEKDQGVGYLPDGTMVVVEDGRESVGCEIKVEVSRLLQTEAGRMIFAKLT